MLRAQVQYMDSLKQKNKSKKLPPKQELFCIYYATDKVHFGNGLQSYAKAYNIELVDNKSINKAKANAHRLLTKDYILNRIDKLLEMGGLNDQRVDKELLFLITQRNNLNVKLGAIKEYNSLRKRIIERKDIEIHEVWTDKKTNELRKKYRNMSTEELLRACVKQSNVM